jgi:hypothetical protein|tara:strand:- start:235 stop:453 length:219 start_codon:yes stop_codon:yes gene_type:complete
MKNTLNKKVQVPLTISQCYGVLTLLKKHTETTLNGIEYGLNDEKSVGAHGIVNILKAVVIQEEENGRKSKIL